jgi:monooxygenase
MGAGLSGIGAACHLQKNCPNKSYAILEARPSMGGTWDLFRYPGIRSDSDMYTLGYNFKPWTNPKSIADGPAILGYIKETAQEHNVASKIQFNTKIIALNWSTENAVNGQLNVKIPKRRKARFLLVLFYNPA